mmetsp:Transcript_83522/g.186653  ORF Transcript_83522/g.186653 Transcript_83522/m.186653 type:complete len:265 (-) Transcript_83522:1058-1852(-)
MVKAAPSVGQWPLRANLGGLLSPGRGSSAAGSLRANLAGLLPTGLGGSAAGSLRSKLAGLLSPGRGSCLAGSLRAYLVGLPPGRGSYLAGNPPAYLAGLPPGLGASGAGRLRANLARSGHPSGPGPAVGHGAGLGAGHEVAIPSTQGWIGALSSDGRAGAPPCQGSACSLDQLPLLHLGAALSRKRTRAGAGHSAPAVGAGRGRSLAAARPSRCWLWLLLCETLFYKPLRIEGCVGYTSDHSLFLWDPAQNHLLIGRNFCLARG